LRAAHAPAIFLEMGADPRLARQLANESGVAVVTELFTESLSPAAGPAPTYLEMMRFNTRTIVDALVALRSIALPSEVLVSQTVKDLTVGADLVFESRGTHALKGVPGEWHVYAVVS